MKIGIVTSGNENLYLFRTLQQIDAEYLVYYDSAQWPYGDKSFESNIASIRKGVEYLLENGCQYVLVSPVYELFFRDQKEFSDTILPLFQLYLDKAFQGSLVGKIALYGDHASLEKAESLISVYAESYQLTESQKNTKKFLFPFSFWSKEVPLWNYLLRRLSSRDYMLNKVVKFDLIYAKDANVDTVLPLQYSYFAHTKTIQNFLNQRKHKFHGRDALAAILTDLLVTKNDNKHDYGVTLFATGSVHMLEQQKELLWLMSRGDSKLFTVLDK